MMYYQQGDVLIIKTNKITGKKQNTHIVQEGEHTGHTHKFLSNNIEIYQDNDKKYLRVLNGSSDLTHEEHLPITIEEGEYEVRIVRQKDPFTKLISKVID